MVCPNCGWSESNHIKKTQSDKEKYLEFWGFTPDTPEAEQAWKEKQAMTVRKAPSVMSDIDGYVSQVDGSWIDSRSKHRNHLKQHRMIELGNDPPTQHRPVEIDRKSQEARKRQIAELAYSKLNYR
jgi:peroxiredoxin